jgi:hypothetical protein
MGMPTDAHGDQGPQSGFEILGPGLGENLSQFGAHLRPVAPAKFGDDRVLSRKVLIERRNIDTCPIGDPIRRQLRVSVATQNVSRGLEQGFNGRAGSFLFRCFSRRKSPFSHRTSPAAKCKLTKYKQLLTLCP